MSSSAAFSGSRLEADILGHIQINNDLFLTLELHNKERVSGLALAERRVKAYCNESMEFVGFWKNHKLLDRFVLNFVIVGFTA